MALVGEKKQMGGLEIVKELQKDNPALRFTANKKRNAVAYWAEDLGRWQVLLCLRLDGSWGRLPDILVDGKTLIPDSDWEEVREVATKGHTL